MCGLGRDDIYDALGRCDLIGKKYGRRLLITVESIERWIAALPEAKIRPPPKVTVNP